MAGYRLGCIIYLSALASISPDLYKTAEMDGAKIISTYVYKVGLIDAQYSYSSAIGLFNTAIKIMMLLIVNTFSKKVTSHSLIPDELYEAAEIDGSNQFSCFFKIVLPLSKTVMAVMALYYGVGHWNDFRNGLIYLKD